ncbi:hypothetical protein OIU77_025002 [Salix suchowensis]|uniref:K-box domain-containing protein n=1 Tax=Salix suchowensis TaxID=1278906 RepID=A0ABQ9BUR7_9ROSI|nr:hypothetical protein OIU77_025002 [Salix suchowensis]
MQSVFFVLLLDFSVQETIERYQMHVKESNTNKQANGQNMETRVHCVESLKKDMNLVGFGSQLKDEAAGMIKTIEILEVSKRKLLGECLGSCTIEDLQQIEQQLERSVSTIRARKTQVYKEKIEHLKQKEKLLTAENAKLSEKSGGQPWQVAREQRENLPSEEQRESSSISDVETELFIGLPETRTKRLPIRN